MADPKKDNATSKASDESQAPGNGDAWGTVHNDEPKSEGTAKATAAESGQTADAGQSGAAGAGEAAGATETAGTAGATGVGEDALDATLEAEAAAAIDEAEGKIDAEAAEAAEAAGAAGNADAAAQKEAAEWKDKYVRLHAEWDTYRRRQKEQAATQKALAAEKLVSSLIPVIDDLERSIDYAQKNGEEGLLGGVEAVLSKFVDTLKKDGVEVIDPAGEAFDALEAQAVGTVDDPSQPEETVADVYQKGYKIGTKVLRPAMVTVTMGGPQRPKPEPEEE